VTAAEHIVVPLRPERTVAVTYDDRDGELWKIRTSTGRAPEARRIANFVPHVQACIEIHDPNGTATTHYRLAVQTKRGESIIEVDATRPLEFVVQLPGLVVEARQADYVREAIERDAVDAPIEVEHCYTGWDHDADGWHFLHVAGAITATGATNTIRATVDVRLAGYTFAIPPSPEATAAIVREAIHTFFDAADRSITLPLFAAVMRAPLGTAPNYAIHLAGQTGSGKTSLAQLAVGFFGAQLAIPDTPVCAWNSTATDLEITTAQARNVCVVLDDYLATRVHEQTADRIVRATTGVTRGRRRGDLTARPTYRPGGLIISTGEDSFGRTSAQARALTIQCAPSLRAPDDAFRQAQRAAADGTFATAQAAHIRTLAERRDRQGVEPDGMPDGWAADVARIRPKISLRLGPEVHARQIEIVTDLATAAARAFLWAEQIGALDHAEAQQLADDTVTALCAATTGTVADEATDAIERLRDALASGHAHITLPQGGTPPDSHLWGWVNDRPGGPCIGYLHDDTVDLLPNVAVEVLRAAQTRTGATPNISRQRLGRLFNDRGWLRRNTNRRTFGMRRYIGNHRIDVWDLPLAIFDGTIEQPHIEQDM
jgi:hypothetical protein